MGKITVTEGGKERYSTEFSNDVEVKISINVNDVAKEFSRKKTAPKLESGERKPIPPKLGRPIATAVAYHLKNTFPLRVGIAPDDEAEMAMPVDSDLLEIGRQLDQMGFKPEQLAMTILGKYKVEEWNPNDQFTRDFADEVLSQTARYWPPEEK